MNIGNPSSATSASRFKSGRSNLNHPEIPSKEASLVFLKSRKMCFDIDVEKLSLESLREYLVRISNLLTKPTVVARLPDNGHQLLQAKQKLIKEIQFREGLHATQEKMQGLSIKCASETNLADAHSVRVCSMERTPDRPRFRPNLALRPPPSGRTESMKELRGVKMIDLPTSLTLQRKQEDRTKEEQMKAKHDRLLQSFAFEDESSSSSDESDNDKAEANESDNDKAEADDELDVFDNIEDGEELQKVVKRYVFNKEGLPDSDKVKDCEKPGPSGMLKMECKQEIIYEQIDGSEESDNKEPNEVKKEPKEENEVLPEPSSVKEEVKKEPDEDGDQDDQLN